MPNDLAIEMEGSSLTDHEMQFAATGLEGKWTYKWAFTNVRDKDAGGSVVFEDDDGKVIVYTPAKPGLLKVLLTATKRGVPKVTQEIMVAVQEKPLTRHDTLPVKIVGDVISGPIAVDLQRAPIADTPDLPLWSVIRASTDKLSFNNYQTWMDRLFCGSPQELRELFADYVRSTLPFPDIISYKALKFATEAFLLANCGVAVARGDLSDVAELNAPLAKSLDRERFERLSEEERDERLGLSKGDTASKLWQQYLVPLDVNGDGDHDRDDYGGAQLETLPYLALIRRNLPEWRIDIRADAEEQIELCDTIMGRKFTSPCFLELLWSYWHEEGMLVHTMHAITKRFQNRSSGPRDPLAGMALDPLRPLNNLLWGYIQDEQHRLTRTRRVYEYDHEYGLTLFGRSAPRLHSADSRSRFLEAFHTLLHRASIFYKEDDDTTMVADPFPVLNALRDVHLLLADGSDNAYGNLPWTVRQEMLMQQWLLARPELREFLPTRTMVAYPEEWMHRVDAMKRLQGWTDTSVRYFRDLAVFGEQIVLSIRYGNWSNTFDREQAGNWARYWREEVKWYINAYESVTGVDISADTQDVRHGQFMPDRFTQPAFLIHDRLLEQRRHLPRYAVRRGARHHHGAGIGPPPGYRPGHELEAEEHQEF